MRSGCLVLLAAAAGAAAACGPDTLTAVGTPGGVYQPGQGCTLVEASNDCPPAPGAGPAPQLRFESAATAAITNSTPSTLSDLRVTCQRSYCGTGALQAHADFQWDDSIPSDPRRMATFVHTFDPPLELYGHTVTFAVSVEGPPVPMHAQIGIVSDYWHWVAWSPLPAGWTRVIGVVSPDNPLTKLDPAATSVMVHALQVDVYVPVSTPAGPTGSWSGTIYLDEEGWSP
jgi:hypothetical protein